MKLSAKTVREYISLESKTSPEQRLLFIERFESHDESFKDVLKKRVSDSLDESEKYLLPYILNKLWIGPKLVYELDVENLIQNVLKRC